MIAFETKTCGRCRVLKPIVDFPLRKSTQRAESWCSTCKTVYLKEYRAANPVSTRSVAKDATLRKKYNLTSEGFQSMADAQEGKCAICGTASPGGRWESLHIDHDHRTNEIRGLLCAACNHGLGNFRDDPKALRAAADYIDKDRT